MLNTSYRFTSFFVMGALERCARAEPSSLRLQCPLAGAARRAQAAHPALPAPQPPCAREAGAACLGKKVCCTYLWCSSYHRWQIPMLICGDVAYESFMYEEDQGVASDKPPKVADWDFAKRRAL